MRPGGVVPAIFGLVIFISQEQVLRRFFAGWFRFGSQSLFCKAKPSRDYKEVIKNWLNGGYRSQKLKRLLKALLEGIIEDFKEMFKDFVINMMSYYDIGTDEPEQLYQAFVQAAG